MEVVVALCVGDEMGRLGEEAAGLGGGGGGGGGAGGGAWDVK